MSPLATSSVLPVSWPPIADCPIPMLDLTAFLQDVPDAPEALGAALRHALEQVGVFFFWGDGLPEGLIGEVFAACARFHAQPLAVKMALRANEHNVGYMPVNGYVSTSSRVEKATRPKRLPPLRGTSAGELPYVGHDDLAT